MIPGVDAPQTKFADAVAPVSLALAQEKRVTDQIVELVKLAREEGELVGEQFLHWFLQEQREEVASMTELLAVVERGKDNLLHVEEHLARAAGARTRSRLVLHPPPAGRSSATLTSPSHMHELRIQTERRSHVLDITREVRDAIAGEHGSAVAGLRPPYHRGGDDQRARRPGSRTRPRGRA